MSGHSWLCFSRRARRAAWSRRRLPLHEGILLAGFTYLALFSVRNVALFAVIAAPILASQLAAMSAPGGLVGRVTSRLGAWLAPRSRMVEVVEARANPLTWPIVVLVGLALVAAIDLRDGRAP
jgi:hypothetical protein